MQLMARYKLDLVSQKFTISVYPKIELFKVSIKKEVIDRGRVAIIIPHKKEPKLINRLWAVLVMPHGRLEIDDDHVKRLIIVKSRGSVEFRIKVPDESVTDSEVAISGEYLEGNFPFARFIVGEKSLVV